MRHGFFHLATGAALSIALSASPALAQKKYDTGATDTEIKIGQTLAFSGPASAYATIGKTQAAYIQMINDQGGINGRKINLIQYDDAYSPPKAVEQMRKLVESDEVLLTFQVLGTPSNAAVQKYLNSKKVPQLFLASGASRWNDPQHFPYTMTLTPIYTAEAAGLSMNCSGFQPSSCALRIDCTANLGVEMLRKTLALVLARSMICESTVASVTS